MTQTATPDLARERERATSLALEAGRVILEIEQAGYDVHDKGDNDPVTTADLESSRIIVRGLKAAFPDDTVISEEDPLPAERAERCWIVDPLDGTRDFVTHTGDYSVMIGLCIANAPVLGVVFRPPTGELYLGASDHPAVKRTLGGEPEPLEMAPVVPINELRLVVSNSHRHPWLDEAKTRLGITDEARRGSAGIKIALVAGGERDLYLHPGRGLKIWDTCAPQAIIEAAGGRVGLLSGSALPYNAHFEHLGGLLATRAELFQPIALALTPGPPEG